MEAKSIYLILPFKSYEARLKQISSKSDNFVSISFPKYHEDLLEFFKNSIILIQSIKLKT